MELIQTFSDGSILTFDTGAFDNWCVYLQPPNQTKYAPTDLHILSAYSNLVKYTNIRKFITILFYFTLQQQVRSTLMF
jgi:hypothetical protein